MQSPKKHLVAGALAGLAFLLVISVIFLAPISDARRKTAQPAQTKTTKRPRPEIVPGEVLVRFKESKALDGSVQLAVPNKARGTQRPDAGPEQVTIRVDRFEGSNLVKGLRIAHVATHDTWKAIAALRARADVLYAEPNYLRHAGNTPNDPSFSSLYGMTKIAAPQAWDLTTGSNGIVVGVVDEGIQLDHTDLQANIWTNPSPGSISGISGDLHGYDFIGNSGTIPPESHATHVAGTIGAVGNNGTGVVGVNWQSSLMSLRFISETTGSGSDADAIRALNYAKQMRDLWISSNHAQGANVRVLNNSYGGAGFSQAFLDAINAINQSDILFVAAAGNNATSNDAIPEYPSNFSAPNVIGVAATDSSDSLAGFSNYGLHSVLLGAPGVGILSTLPSNSYGTLSGTSMATPHVAGAAALLLAANSNLTVNQLRALLAYNGDAIASLQGKTVTGRRLNVFKSLQALNENDTTLPGTVGNFQITSQNGRTISLSWTASGDDGAAGQASLYDISFVDGSTSAVVPLTSVVPATSGTLQTASVTIPFRHSTGTIKLREFDNVGNEGTPSTMPVSVPLLIADPYVPSTAAPASLSTGGTAMAMNCDDCLKSRTLPFTFPFFGTSYNSVTISSNGNLYFVPPAAPTRANGDADDVPGSTVDLSRFRMIAGMWDDLDLRTSRRADADVFVVQSDSTHVIFRWQGVQFGDGVNGDPINFEIELSADGTIKTRYGSGNTNLLPVVGISGGEPDAYVIDSLTSEQSPMNLTNSPSAIFTPRILSSGCPSFNVTSNADTSDAAAGDGVCATSASVCTLRAAIEEANALTCGAIDINFSGVTSPIVLATALPALNHNINVLGPGASALTVMRSTASGTANFGIFTVNHTVVNISGLTISGGIVDNLGGGIYLNGGTLTLTNTVVTGNTSHLQGGGIFQLGGAVTLTNSTVSGNSGWYSGGGIDMNGGVLTLINSNVSSNFGGLIGGGIDNQLGTVTLTTSTVSNNVTTPAGGQGGGIVSSGGTLNLTSSTVSGNNSGAGGGIYNGSTATLTNSTVSGNQGGGLTNVGTLTLSASTVTANTITFGDGGGIYNSNTAAANLKDTIVAGNTAGGTGPDLKGTFNSQDYNLIGNNSGATFTGNTTHNITNVNPLLGPLENYGGLTLTHVLLPGSPAIDAGNSSLTTDQRGQARPIDDPGVANAAGGNASDIGAFETPGPPPTPNPCRDAWTSTSIAPGARNRHTAVWTGTEMIVWGGFGGINLNDGGRYNPTTNSWVATSSTNSPAARNSHTAIWTGSEMIIWGGYDGAGALNSGARYKPSTNMWTPITTTNAPPARALHTAVWTGKEMIIWGGLDGSNNPLNNGARYDPSTDSWSPLTMTNAPTPRADHTAIWTGSEMIIWGGNGLGGANGFDLNSGAKYNPFSNSWRVLSTVNVPAPRGFHTAVWTGTEMIIWGGGGKFNTGGRYNPTTDSWLATSTTNAPAGRVYHQAVWTGSEMLVWGGEGLGLSNLLNTGGRYVPGSDDWNSTSTTNAPAARRRHTAVWTGGQMIIWGGDDSTSLDTGGSYCAEPGLRIDSVLTPVGRTSGGQQITLYGSFANLFTVTMGGTLASWSYTNGGADVSAITITTPAHAVGAVQIDLALTSGPGYSKASAFAYLPTVFTDDTIIVGQTTAKAQHIIELRQAVDALRAVAGLSGAPWADSSLQPGDPIKAIHIVELRTFLDDAATRLGYSTSPYTDPGLGSGFMIKRVHLEELRQRVRTIAR
jgi:CSLREA domain-containing protein